MADLRQQAEDLGIDVDPSWDDEKTRQEINKARAEHARRKQTAKAPRVEKGTGEANESIPSVGNPRVRTSEEMRQEEEEAIPAAPLADPKQSHAVAAGRVEREKKGLPEFKTSDLKGDPNEPDQVVPVRLLYDWWDAQGVRHARGTTLDVPLNEAKRLIGERKAERADPLPGDDR